MTTIEWTEATWNPIAGCSIVSPGCTNCYAMRRVAPRLAANPATPQYHGTVEKTKAGYVWTGKIGIASDKVLTKPLRWKKPRKIFVNSTSDLFHEDVPDHVIDKVFAVMAICPQHTFQVLTKRPARMREYLSGLRQDGTGMTQQRIIEEAGCYKLTDANTKNTNKEKVLPLPNVWLGVSVEDHHRANERREHLNSLSHPGWKTFVSYEPALGQVPWSGWEFIDWMICGGESGHGARPMHPEWVRSTKRWCDAVEVPFLFKQWGENIPLETDADWEKWGTKTATHSIHLDQNFARVGKKAAGRLLDGVLHDGYPCAKKDSG